MISGRLVRVPTQLDQSVQADEVLFELYAEDIWLELEQAEALRDAAEAELNRQTLLFSQGKAIAEEKLSGLRLEFSVRETQVAMIEEKIEQHRVRSPLAGNISDLSAFHLGEWVQAGQRLAVVAEPQSDQVSCRVSPQWVGELKAGAEGWAWAGGSPVGVELLNWGSDPNQEGIGLSLQLPQALPHGQPLRLLLWLGWKPLWQQIFS